MADSTSAGAHPAATQHLPSFIAAPGETDVLMVAMVIILILSVVGFGVLFLRLHTLPERIAHGRHKLQFEIVAVLGLIALFTHMHIFWIIGLLLALVDLPDFGTPLNRIAGSAEVMAGLKPNEGAYLGQDDTPEPEAHVPPPEPDGEAAPHDGAAVPHDGVVVPVKPAAAKHKDAVHA